MQKSQTLYSGLTEQQKLRTIADMLRRRNTSRAINFAKSVVKDAETKRKVSELLTQYLHKRVILK